jgi:hypothetical protein
MTRTLKALALALVAIFAMSALAASAAQAVPVFWTAEHAKIKISPDTGNDLFVTKFGTATCSEWTAKATLETPNLVLTAENVEYKNCHTTAMKFPTTVNMNGCQYLFTVLTEEDATHFNGEVHLVCPANKEVIITVTSAGKTICKFLVPEQTWDGVSYLNSETAGVAKIITGTIDTKKVKDTYTGTLCGTGAETTAEYRGNFLMHAENLAGKAIDLKVKP